MRKNWHELEAKEVLDAFETGPDGLSQEDADARLREYGLNNLPVAVSRGQFFRFLRQFNNVLIYVLLASAGITLLLGKIVDTAVILAVVLANAAIGFIQEGKAEKAMEAIRRMLAARALVLRDGKRQHVDAERLVPGDIVVLQAGDKVAADLRLLETAGLQIQESVLTGESVPVSKSSSPVGGGTVLADQTSMTFSGTLVTAGSGKAVVVATGTHTETGRISGMISKVQVLATPLVQQMNVFARWLTLLILVIAATLSAYGYFVEHMEFGDVFMAVVGLSVAAIPEGLPAVFTITLAVGVQGMARRNAIVRRLPSIETLGSVSVICTDKTGTLTRNEMMVTSIITSANVFSVEGTGYEPRGRILLEKSSIRPADNTVLEEIGLFALLCNDASLTEAEDGWTMEGDPMDGALLALAGKIGVDVKREIAAWTRMDVIPFDSRHKFMATLHRDSEGGGLIAVKGAPENVLSMCCDQRSVKGNTEELDEAYWQEKIEQIVAQGQRVLALAVRRAGADETRLSPNHLENSMTFVGLLGLIDPPRVEAVEAIAECQGAGIQVKMITGDHKGTAEAIGRQIGLIDSHRVLSGGDLDAMDDDHLCHAVLRTAIFARTSPEHKLRLVKALQSQRMTVAMTGDGVNDAPALKMADVGIAMGKTGSEVAKEAAEIVLADDNFASIVAAVREGRTVYDNFKKVIGWTLPTSTGEAMTIVVALLLGMTLPVTPIQILWVNLITVATLGLALAFEPTESNTMLRPPRRRGEPLLKKDLASQIVLVSVLFLGGVFGIFAFAMERNYSLELARTMAVNTLVVMEIFQLFFIRNMYSTSLTWQMMRGTKVVWATVIIVIVAQLAITYLAPLQRMFATAAVPLVDGLLIISVGVISFAIVEIQKQVRLNFPRH